MARFYMISLCQYYVITRLIMVSRFHLNSCLVKNRLYQYIRAQTLTLRAFSIQQICHGIKSRLIFFCSASGVRRDCVSGVRHDLFQLWSVGLAPHLVFRPLFAWVAVGIAFGRDFGDPIILILGTIVAMLLLFALVAFPSLIPHTMW